MIDKPIYRMSGVGGCPRAISAERLGYESEEKPVYLDIAAREGQRHEIWMKEDLRANDIAVYGEQQELTLEFDTFKLVGHIDGILNYPFYTSL